MLAAFIGLCTGALYRSGLTNLKSFRVSPWIVSTISSLVGSSRPPHMPARAMPGERPPFASEQVLTRRRTNETTDDTVGQAAPAGEAGATRGSVMREWVDELTGRRDGGRVPSATEIAELTAVFPHARREEIVDALQRRYATYFAPFKSTYSVRQPNR
ncbi:hypothetical protein FRC08_001197 [Ceratobasidium sp. 394]|nr:hypothetical protein FRC08_001197 [Ceratobasidium sp. 394]